MTVSPSPMPQPGDPKYISVEEAARRDLARMSADWYQKAFKASGKLRPLINYATMTALGQDPRIPLGKGPTEAEKLARAVLKRAKKQGPDTRTELPAGMPPPNISSRAGIPMEIRLVDTGFTSRAVMPKVRGKTCTPASVIRKVCSPGMEACPRIFMT